MPAISSKPFKAGDVILETKPLFICIRDDMQSIHCNNCLKKWESLKRCGKCHKMYYCDKNCQMNDWKYHKNECKIYKSDKSLAPLHVRYLLRLWLCVKTDPEFGERRHQLVDGSDVSINEIKVDIKKLSSLFTYDNNVKIRFDQIFNKFKEYGISFTHKELFYWYAFALKSFNQPIMYYDKNPIQSFKSIHISIGRGLYIQLSNLSHSCLPNSGLTINGLSFHLRALKSINSGDQITNSYIHLGYNKLDKQKALHKILEECHCDRCQLDLDKDWNYKEYDQMFTENYYQWSKIDNISISRTINANYLIDEKFIKYLQLFHGEYNPNQNELILTSFICYAHHSKLSNPSTLTRWYEFLKKSMAITHGTDHPLYEMLSTVYYNCI